MGINSPSDSIDKQLANYLIHDVDIEAIIKVVKHHHNDPELIQKLQKLNTEYKDLVYSTEETANSIRGEAPQFQVFHILRKELASSQEDLHSIIEELHSDEAVKTLIERFEDKTNISIIGPIMADQELGNRYKTRVATFRKHLYEYFIGDYKSENATMNYLMSTKKTLAELLIADNKSRGENGQNNTSGI